MCGQRGLERVEAGGAGSEAVRICYIRAVRRQLAVFQSCPRAASLNSVMHVKNIRIADYSYDLPAGAIAYHPLAERDASRLLVYRAGELHEDIYRNIARYLPEGALLVFNNTRVVEARIVFQKPTGGQIEIFCLEPPAEYGGIAAALTQKGSVRWKCLIGGDRKSVV